MDLKVHLQGFLARPADLKIHLQGFLARRMDIKVRVEGFLARAGLRNFSGRSKMGVLPFRLVQAMAS